MTRVQNDLFCVASEASGAMVAIANRRGPKRIKEYAADLNRRLNKALAAVVANERKRGKRG